MTMRKYATVKMLVTLPVLATAALLQGCVSDEMALDDTYYQNSGSSQFPIEYAKGPVTMSVDTSHGALQPAQVQAVAGFARQSMSGGLTPVVIRRPAGGGASARMAEEIAGLMLMQGLPREMIRMGTYPAPASAPVQLTYVKSYAHTKPCGDWTANAAETDHNRLMPNHGCAVQSNIAALIADPQDVVSPKPATPVHSAVGNVAIRKQHMGQSQTGFGSLFNIFGG
jgi:pilus assembly protein CpaD